MAGNKTRATGASVEAFLDSACDPARRADADALAEMMGCITGEPACMWGAGIIGFGTYHYRYASGHEGDAPLLGFSPRKNEFSIYLGCEDDTRAALLGKLGRHRMGKGCLYLKKLAEVDPVVLEQLLRHSASEVRRRYG